MMKCVYVCLSVTFLLILPSPCQADDDIYIMMKCVYVCLSVTFLLILPFPYQAYQSWNIGIEIYNFCQENKVEAMKQIKTNVI